MGVNADDIISFEMTCKFDYKNCEVTVRKFNNIVDVGIVSISEKGYIIEKHKTVIIDPGKFNRELAIMVEHKLGFVERIYQSVTKKGIANDSKIRDFEIN